MDSLKIFTEKVAFIEQMSEQPKALWFAAPPLKYNQDFIFNECQLRQFKKQFNKNKNKVNDCLYIYNGPKQSILPMADSLKESVGKVVYSSNDITVTLKSIDKHSIRNRATGYVFSNINTNEPYTQIPKDPYFGAYVLTLETQMQNETRLSCIILAACSDSLLIENFVMTSLFSKTFVCVFLDNLQVNTPNNLNEQYVALGAKTPRFVSVKNGHLVFDISNKDAEITARFRSIHKGLLADPMAYCEEPITPGRLYHLKYENLN